MIARNVLAALIFSPAAAGCALFPVSNNALENPNLFVVRPLETVVPIADGIEDTIIYRDRDKLTWINLASGPYKEAIEASSKCNVQTAAISYWDSEVSTLSSRLKSHTDTKNALVVQRNASAADDDTAINSSINEIDRELVTLRESSADANQQLLIAKSSQKESQSVCVTDRNRIIAAYLGVSDDICDIHLAKTQESSAQTNILLGGVTSAASLAATVVGAGGGPRALAAVGGFSNSMRSLTNEELFLQKIAPIITGRIRSERRKLREEIISGLKKPTNDYPVEAALADIKEYHGACSFAVGLELVATASATRGTVSKESISDAITDLDTQITWIDGRIGNQDANMSLSADALVDLKRDREQLIGRRQQLVLQRSNFITAD